MTAESVARADSLRARIDDWMNPIVVKELRQAVQSRFVVAALFVLLVIQLTAIGVYLFTIRSANLDFDAGRQVFLMLYGILLFISMLFVPLYTAIRLVTERSDTNVDLLFITTIKPRSIIGGKLLSAVVLTILIFSACLPFTAFTYFLRGIDLPSIFIVLAFGFCLVIFCTQVSIFIAAVPINRIFKLLVGIVGLWLIVSLFVPAMFAVTAMLRLGVGSRLGDWEFWEAVIGSLSLFVFITGLLFVLSVALITPLAANRALPVRIYIALASALLFAEALIVSWIDKEHDFVSFWVMLLCPIFALALFAGVSERDRLGRRVLRSVPRPAWLRVMAFFFFSGAASGVIWAVSGIGLTLLLAWGWSRRYPGYAAHGDLVGMLQWMGAMCLYLFCYAITGAFLRRLLLTRISNESTWVLGMFLIILGSTIPILTGYLLFFSEEWIKTDYLKWLVGNPFAWSNKQTKSLYLGVPAVWALIMTALHLRWFIVRVRDFHRGNT